MLRIQRRYQLVSNKGTLGRLGVGNGKRTRTEEPHQQRVTGNKISLFSDQISDGRMRACQTYLFGASVVFRLDCSLRGTSSAIKS